MAHTWTEQEKEVIRCEYRGTRASLAQIAGKLNLSPSTVKAEINRMGLAKRTDRSRWDAKQDDQLRELMPRYCAEHVATKVAKRAERELGCYVLGLVEAPEGGAWGILYVADEQHSADWHIVSTNVAVRHDGDLLIIIITLFIIIINTCLKTIEVLEIRGDTSHNE